ncbi:MAG: hypothetical protein OXQ29_15255 [Rhodospirillaceae bacterium]|nr:hypothetical protein [Rhodospirillaceae bacterium]
MQDEEAGNPTRDQSNPHAQRIANVTQFLRAFRLERYVYVGLGVLAALMILGLAGVMLVKGSYNWGQVTTIFGSGGLFTYSSGRLLTVFDKAWNHVFD